ncbi:MAG: metallopeptidase [Candidatus Levybacteria bacterium]|nr:metallopeptidase [Candidatus Levybacteria bacterium]
MWRINIRKKNKKLEWEEADDVKKDIAGLLKIIDFPYIDPKRIYCYRTYGSKSRSYARIWSFPKIFQHALKIDASYVIEVLSKYYDKLDANQQKKVLIHELLHIPKNFSGALLPHRSRGRHLNKQVNKLFEEYKSAL